MVDDGERAEINRQYEEFSGLPLSAEMLANEVQLAVNSNSNLNQYVSSFADSLTGHGKAILVKVAFHTMSASGELRPGHQKQLADLAQTLAIPQSQYMELIDRMTVS